MGRSYGVTLSSTHSMKADTRLMEDRSWNIGETFHPCFHCMVYLHDDCGKLVLALDMVENSTSLCKPTSGWMFVIGLSRQAFSSQSEAPSELFCGYLHRSARDMIRHPIRLRCLSSGNLWQGTRKHLARRPTSMGSASCHRWSALSVALRHQLTTTHSRLHERYPQ